MADMNFDSVPAGSPKRGPVSTMFSRYRILLVVMKTLLLIFIYLLPTASFAQVKKVPLEQAEINKTIMGFLKWYKTRLPSTAPKNYSIATGGYPDTTTQKRINWEGVEKYLNEVRESKFVSENFIDSRRRYIVSINKVLEQTPPLKELRKMYGMDTDFIFPSDEPEEVLDHIDKARIRKLDVIYNKAIVSMYFSKYVNVVFTLTKGENKRWYIDYMGYDDPNLYRVLK